MARHPENEAPLGVLIVRPESSLIYANADAVLGVIMAKIEFMPSQLWLVICDLSASPFIDLAGSRMIHELQGKLKERSIDLRIVGARAYVRELLRADGVADKVDGINKTLTIADVVHSASATPPA
jgi:MFS superfamily sulfate permease-like transporter